LFRAMVAEACAVAGDREEAHFVLGVMERRMSALGFNWRDTTATQVYTVFDRPFPGSRGISAVRRSSVQIMRWTAVAWASSGRYDLGFGRWRA